MTMTDPIADMLTRIRNGNTAYHDEVRMPSSKSKEALARILEREGYIGGWSVADSTTGPGRVLTVQMKYSPERVRTISGIKRVSRPGLRVYRKADGLPPRPGWTRGRRTVHEPGDDDRPGGAQATNGWRGSVLCLVTT